MMPMLGTIFSFFRECHVKMIYPSFGFVRYFVDLVEKAEIMCNF